MTDLFEGRTWFVVNGKTGSVEFARDKLLEQGYDVWLPMCRVQVRKARQTKIVERPLFLRYFFVGMTTEQPFRPIVNTPGIAFVLRDGNGFAQQIRVVTLQAIKRRLDEAGGVIDFVPKPFYERWRKGRPLRVIKGPFDGFEGAYVGVRNGKVRMALDLFGRTMIFDVDAGWVTDELGSPGPAVAVVDAA